MDHDNELEILKEIQTLDDVFNINWDDIKEKQFIMKPIIKFFQEDLKNYQALTSCVRKIGEEYKVSKETTLETIVEQEEKFIKKILIRLALYKSLSMYFEIKYKFINKSRLTEDLKNRTLH